MIGAIAGGAALGGIAGAMKSGKSRQISELERQAYGYSQESLGAFANLVRKGPNEVDYTRGLDAQRDLATLLQGFQANGLYDMSKGRNLASQAFAGQRMALQQAFEDQMQSASRSAQLAGRSSNDPILRAKLAQEQMRQSALLDAQQSAAAVDFGRQSSLDTIQMAGDRTNILASLGNQALSNQASLFQMGQTALEGERSFSLNEAKYEQSRGGGLKGALTGMIAGAGAGMQMASGMGAMGGASGPAGGAAGGMNPAMAASNPLMSGFQFGAASATTQAAMGPMQDTYSYGYSAPAVAAPRPRAPAPATVYGPPMPAPGYGPVYGPPNPFRR